MTKIPSIESMEILAVSDRAVFESLMNHIGLRIEGRVNEDPLETRVQSESVVSIASEITEDANNFVRCNPRLQGFKQMAEDYGYVVSIRPRR
jgi:hypothetical protein